jgi:hypothetical protein
MVLDPGDTRNPRLPLKCCSCDLRLTYLGTHARSDKQSETHIYRCETHGLFRYETPCLSRGRSSPRRSRTRPASTAP